MPHKPVPMLGKRFGRLVVLAEAGRRSKWRVRYLKCRCDCGTETETSYSNLATGAATSCGCYRREFRLTHGAAVGGKSQAYQAWCGMRQRCENPKDASYAKYGGRGIGVCAEWASYETFLADLGERPAGHTLERKDNNGNYEPGNCRWATPHEQARNTRRNIVIECDGRRMVLRDWVNELGLNSSTVQARIRRGWTVGRALGMANARRLSP